MALAQPPSTRQTRTRMTGEERRRAIIAAARPIFAKHGYHAASTAEIASAAGCSEALLYRHFDSKHALLLAILADGADTVQTRLYDTISSADDPFAALCSRWAELAADSEYRDVLRVRAQAATVSQDPELRETLRGIREGFRGIIHEALQVSQSRGHIRPEIEIDAVGRLYGGLTFAAAFAASIEGGHEVEALGAAARALVAAIRPLDG